MSHLNREQVATFRAVLESGSFEAAAAHLHVTQPAVSQRIRALEQQVGRVLLRRTRPLEPTPSGRTLLRHAVQLAHLEQEIHHDLGLAGASGEDAGTGPVRLVVAANSDSLATWFLDAVVLADSRLDVGLEVLREDEFHASRLLADGTAMAAVTAEPAPVRGCTTTRLGALRYLACASPGFTARHFPDGATPAEIARAPSIVFDRRDGVQQTFNRRALRHDVEPRHYVPSAAEYCTAVAAGIGWGLLPERHAAPLLDSGELVELVPGRHLDIPLSWQAWRVGPTALEQFSGIVVETARQALHQRGAAQS